MLASSLIDQLRVMDRTHTIMHSLPNDDKIVKVKRKLHGVYKKKTAANAYQEASATVLLQ